MLGIMLQKMWHKKWMNLSLLLGCILMVATAVSFPLYQEAAYDRMLQDEFKNYLTTNGGWPTENTMTIVSKKERGGTTILNMEKMIPSLYTDLGVTEKETVKLYYLPQNGIHSTMNRQDADELKINLAGKSNMNEHITMLSGEKLPESGLTEDGAVAVVISQSCMVSKGLLVGETITFDALKDADGNAIYMYIAGVFAENDGDVYWENDNAEFTENAVFMDFDLFRQMFTGDNAVKFTVTCNYTAMFEYSNIKASAVDDLVETTDYYTTQSGFRSVMGTPKYRAILDTYLNKRNRISTTLIILQVPVLLMLAAFLLMISGQMYEMEKSEISVIKSRGSSRGQIFRLYLYQGILITLVGAAVGLVLGRFFSELLGSTRNFLVFDFSERLEVHFTTTSFIYAGAASLLALLCLTIPAIRHSKVSIVHLKQGNALKKKAWWEKIFLDVVLIAVAGYGYYNFHKNSADMATSVLTGEALDPLLYLSSSVMIIGCGLLFLRLQPLIIQLIHLLGKRWWKPASYVSFMENIKNGRKQQMIMLFLIMTVSLGMYHATVARTILDNAVNNMEYLDATDLVVKEVWTELKDRDGAYTGQYIEPDFSKYTGMTLAESCTKVYYDEKAYVSTGSTGRQSVILMGIHTKEYGSMTKLSKSLLGKSYRQMLNDLAVEEKGVLVSSNFSTKLGYSVGDSINYANGKGNSLTGKIVGFFDYWPGYAPTSAAVNGDGSVEVSDNYLVVTRYDYILQKWGTLPYEVWIDLKDTTTVSDVTNWLEEHDVRLTKYINKASDMAETQSDPLLQGTNGVLTMGFVVTILLCAVGYLIYWIMSIKERELIFGVLRASGFHKGELFHMLINEQIFSGIFSIAAGWGIGKLTSYLFVPILQKAYASTTQVLPMELITNDADMIRLGAVTLGVMVVCLIVLLIMVLRMNVAKALKLGEE